jgi:hypothetical protein
MRWFGLFLDVIFEVASLQWAIPRNLYREGSIVRMATQDGELSMRRKRRERLFGA